MPLLFFGNGMRPLGESIRLGKKIRVLGVDDAPFARTRGLPVQICSILCSDTRFEGMITAHIRKDGIDATDVLIAAILNCKFYPQIQVILTDGIAFGGFNLIDLPRLSAAIERPCIAVMRKMPDLVAINKALGYFEDAAQRRALLARAGTIYQSAPFVYQVMGCEPEIAAQVLQRLTDQGHVPEALRLAHLIGSAIKTGESSNRA